MKYDTQNRFRPIGKFMRSAVLALTLVASPIAAISAQAQDLRMFTPTGQAVSFDPAMGAINIYNMLAPVYDTLIRMQSDGTFEPNLATAWTWDSPTQMTLTLREGVTFSDGADFNAAAAKANLENVKNGTGSYAGQFSTVTSIEAPDATTLVITLSKPNPSLTILLASIPGMMASPDALGTEGLATMPVGTGPYTYDADASISNDTLVYHLKDDYWNPGHYHFENFTLRIFQDEMSAANAVVSGEVDVSEFGAPNAQVRAREGGAAFTGAAYNAWGMMILDRDGTMVPAFGDVRVRQAMNYAINRPAVVDAINQGIGTPTTSLLKSWMPGYVEELNDEYPYDPDKARELLAEAGYADGFSFKTVNLSFFDQHAQAVQAMLADVGITMEIENVPGAQYIPSIFSGEFPAAYIPYGAVDSYYDIGQVYTEDAPFNPFKVASDELAELYTAAASATPEERADLLSQINTLVVTEAWGLPVNFDSFGLAYDPESVTPQPWTGIRPPLLYDWTPVE